MVQVRVIVFVVAAVWSSTAQAATAEELEQARARSSNATTHYNLGEFSAALKEYQEAYRLTRDPALLFNIGQCQWKMGDDRAAVHSYRAYLRNGTDPANRQRVEARIEELERRIKANEASREQGPATPATPAPATAAGEPPVAAAPADVAPAAVESPAAIPPAPPIPTASPAPLLVGVPPEAAAAPEREAPAIYTRWWFWTAIGALVAGGVVTALVLTSGSADAPTCPAGTSCK